MGVKTSSRRLCDELSAGLDWLPKEISGQRAGRARRSARAIVDSAASHQGKVVETSLPVELPKAA
jgi:hypothetical protein